MKVFVGLDCGGSSSRLIAVNENSQVLFQGQAGSANLSSTPERMIATNLRKAAEGCPEPDFVCGCFAGLLTDQDRQRAITHLKYIFPSATIKAEADCMAAIFASSPLPDACVIAGTGSLICSLKDNVLHKSGGGGYILGDDGSACVYGRDALREYLYHREDNSEALLKAIEEAFGSTDYSAVIARVYHSNSPAAVISKLAKVVAQEAKRGVEYAIESVDRNSSQFAKLVIKHIKTYVDSSKWQTGVDTVTSGGLWKTDPLFREKFSHYVLSFADGINVQIAPVQSPPVRGALKLALMMENGN